MMMMTVLFIVLFQNRTSYTFGEVELVFELVLDLVHSQNGC